VHETHDTNCILSFITVSQMPQELYTKDHLGPSVK